MIDMLLADDARAYEGMLEAASNPNYRAICGLFRSYQNYRQGQWKAIRKAYSLHYVARLSDAQFFALMYGMTCG